MIQVSKETQEWLDGVGVMEIKRMNVRDALKERIPVMAHIQRGDDIVFGINDRGLDVSLKGIKEFEELQ